MKGLEERVGPNECGVLFQSVLDSDPDFQLNCCFLQVGKASRYATRQRYNINGVISNVP